MARANRLSRLFSLSFPQGRRRLAALSCVVLIILAGAAAVVLVRGVENQLEDVVRTHQLREAANELALRLVDAQSGQRGYLLTGSEAYLEPYETAVSAVDGNIVRLTELTAGRPVQHARIDGIIDDIDRLRGQMEQTIALAQSGELEQARALLNTDTGLALMVAIRGEITSFLDEEQRMLDARTTAISRYRQWIVIAIIVALAAAAGLAYTLFARAQRQLWAFSESQTRLQSDNEALEAAVRERTTELEQARLHAERERARVETLLQDANHRIGNSLATVSSLLGLQLNRTRSPQVRSALEAAQARVMAISSGHRRLRLGDDLETVHADEFLEAVMDDLRATQLQQRPIALETQFEAITIPARDATTIGIILGELVMNALKHAFDGRQDGHIWAQFALQGEVPVLVVEDDGCGISSESEDDGSGLGSVIIQQLARQFGGVPSYGSREGGGTVVSVVLNELSTGKAQEPPGPSASAGV